MSKRKTDPKQRSRDLSQFGLMGIPDNFDDDNDNDNESDGDLEAELAAIVSGGSKAKLRPKPPPPTMASSDLDKMIAASLKDIGSDDDDDDSVDEDDLSSELKDLTGGEIEIDAEQSANNPETDQSTAEPPAQPCLPTTAIDTITIIRNRMAMYEEAEANAKAAGETAKVRRLGRGLKTLKDLLKKANTGNVDVNDIPPEVSVKPKSVNVSTPSPSDEVQKSPMRVAPPLPQPDETPKVPTRVAPPPPSQSITTPEAEKPQNPIMKQLLSRQEEYKVAALQKKRGGDVSTALQFMRVWKQFDVVIKMAEDGQEVDLSDMPPSPDQFLEFMATMQATEEPPAAPEPQEVKNIPPEVPTSMLEALQQRLNKYKSVEESAKAEGNASKARRFGRIVKQYEDAIKLHKAGGAVAYDELPVPPGFGPLPIEGSGNAPAQQTPQTVKSSPTSTRTTSESSLASDVSKNNLPQKPVLTTRITGNHQKNNLAEEQMKILLDRQREFKVAALEAKKAGEIDQAIEYLKIYKGFDSLLNAASSGLPVDLTTLPLPPSQRENLEASFAIVGETIDSDSEDISDISIRVEEQLAKQLMMCKNTRDHHKAMGDIAGMNRFENLAITVQKDLDLVRYSKRKNFSLPKFHYEKRSFNIVHCNTELTDNEMEIVIVRGINYKVANPKDVDTYVKVEFALPNDEFFKTKTNVIKNTDSPNYDARFILEIQRNNRAFLRIFKRHGVKFEIYSRGGFLRSDILIGVVNVKLQPLETKCEIHDTYNLMEGRKPVGGQLEVKLRVRNPILTKQVEHVNEKWLVLDG